MYMAPLLWSSSKDREMWILVSSPRILCIFLSDNQVSLKENQFWKYRHELCSLPFYLDAVISGLQIQD